MSYQIFIGGEKLGELSESENARLRKEAMKDMRTWFVFAFALATAIGRFLAYFVRVLGLTGGLALLAAVYFAPQFLPAFQTHPGGLEAVTLSLREWVINLCLLSATFSGASFCLSPRLFGVTDVFENEFNRRVRQLKNIRRHGQLEIITKPTSGHQADQSNKVTVHET